MNLIKTNLTKAKMNYYNLPHDIFNLIQSFVIDDKKEHIRKHWQLIFEFKRNRLNVMNRFKLMTYVFEQSSCRNIQFPLWHTYISSQYNPDNIDIPQLLKTCKQELKYYKNYTAWHGNTSYKKYLDSIQCYGKLYIQ